MKHENINFTGWMEHINNTFRDHFNILFYLSSWSVKEIIMKMYYGP